MAALTPTGFAVLELIRISGGSVVVTIQHSKLAFATGSATVSYHWIEDFIAAGLLEPGDAALLPGAEPQSWKLSETAIELLDRAA